MASRLSVDPRVAKALAKYREVHWGVKGKGALSVDVPDPFLVGEVPVVLGELVSVTYGTIKGGDGKIVNYEHAFGKRGRGLPLLAFNSSGLLIAGGDYTVNFRGIVG
jgi:hypothetical protein